MEAIVPPTHRKYHFFNHEGKEANRCVLSRLTVVIFVVVVVVVVAVAVAVAVVVVVVVVVVILVVVLLQRVNHTKTGPGGNSMIAY